MRSARSWRRNSRWLPTRLSATASNDDPLMSRRLPQIDERAIPSCILVFRRVTVSWSRGWAELEGESGDDDIQSSSSEYILGGGGYDQVAGLSDAGATLVEYGQNED